MRKYNIFVIVLLFLFIYEPPLFSINVLHVLGLFSWIYIAVDNVAISYFLELRKVMRIYAGLILFFMYLLIIVLINQSTIIFTLSFMYWLMDIFPFSIALCVYFFRKKYSFYDFLNILLIVGTLQGIAALSAFFIPNVQELFIDKLTSYGYSDVFVELSKFRMYGFASNLTFSTPIVQSMLGMISIYLAINKDTKYIFFTPLLLFSAIINARISLIIILIGLTIIAVSRKRVSLKSILRGSIISLILISIIIVGLDVLEGQAYETYMWISAGFDEFSILLDDSGNGTNAYYAYFTSSETYLLPEGLSMLFGVGERVLGVNNYGVRSDVGYINDIWLGGILYSIILYLSVIILHKDAFVNNKSIKNVNFFYMFFIATFFVCNYKGYIFGMNNFTNLFILVYVFSALRKKNIIEGIS